MKLAIRHSTRYAYAPPAQSAAMRVKLFPTAHDGQRVLSWTVTANGAPVAPAFRNGWGDDEAALHFRGGVERVEILAEGSVETTDTAGVLRGFRAAMRPSVCLRETRRTRADEAIRALAHEAAGLAETPLARAHALADMLAERIAYTPGATDFGATAAEALAAGEGVCQDHAHALIAAARALGWPARYVAGYYLASAEGGDVATHAWAEIWVDGLGWVGFDPSNKVCPTDSYVRVSSGLDAADAAPLRGHFDAGAEETMEVDVEVLPAAAQSQSQTQ